MTPRPLADWLRYLEELHPVKWDLGLERVATVAGRMGVLPQTGTTFLVAGTNGKGSTVALLAALAHAHGYTTGVSTSPHLLRFNERIALNGEVASDEEICAAFERIDEARGEISLTYFEFGTLAALLLFQAHRPEVVVLEVGLGGRLDAMNIVDPDVAIVTGIDLDHQAWLGEDREAIAREKAGVFRHAIPAIVGDPAPPRSLLEEARRIGANLVARGDRFDVERMADSWRFRGAARDGSGVVIEGLPYPQLHVDNAASALAAWLQSGLRFDGNLVAAIVGNATLAGRCQWLSDGVAVLLDVGHNPHAAQNLAAVLQNSPCERETIAVLAMYKDKDCEEFSHRLAPHVDRWYCAGIDGDRGQSAAELRDRLSVRVGSCIETCDTVVTAYRHARKRAREGDRIVVTGSFLTVAAVLETLSKRD